MMMTKLGQGPATVRIGCEIHNNITFQPKIYKKTLTFQRCGGGGGAYPGPSTGGTSTTQCGLLYTPPYVYIL